MPARICTPSSPPCSGCHGLIAHVRHTAHHGGRPGDITARAACYHRAALFGLGSLTRVGGHLVTSLLSARAIIEGIGASDDEPATLAIWSKHGLRPRAGQGLRGLGAQRGGAVGGRTSVGGFFHDELLWRWSFRIKVCGRHSPSAVLVFMRRTRGLMRDGNASMCPRMLIRVGMFLLVFALSEGGSHG